MPCGTIDIQMIIYKFSLPHSKGTQIAHYEINTLNQPVCQHLVVQFCCYASDIIAPKTLTPLLCGLRDTRAYNFR